MNKQYRQFILETFEIVLEIQLNSIQKILNKEEVRPTVVQRRERKRKSLAHLCVELLTEKQSPLHVDELVELLKVHHGRVTDRDSLASSLAKKAKQGILVRRVSPATFELIQ